MMGVVSDKPYKEDIEDKVGVVVGGGYGGG